MVASFNQLVTTHFVGENNALCWHRTLQGDFQEIVAKLVLKEEITEVSVAELCALSLSVQAQLAREIILADLQLLSDFGACPTLNLLKCYPRDHVLDFFATDVYSYHVDRSAIAMDTYLCTYHGVATEILPNDQVEQKILIPEIRQKLKQLHNGSSTEFADFLQDNYFDLHYQATAGAQAINLGVGHLWRLATDHPSQQVAACVHRAPIENHGEYRLLLIC